MKTTRNGVGLNELDEGVRERIRQNPGLAAMAVAAAMGAEGPKRKRDEAAIGRKRLETGSNFEADLQLQHESYQFQGMGHVRRNHAPSKMIRGKTAGAKAQRVITGAADVDWSGWVAVAQPGADSPFTLEQADSRPWIAKPWHRGGTVVPVSFDAKVQPRGRRTYRHEVDKQHQLHSLKAAAECGEFAFLLVLVRDWWPEGARIGAALEERVFLLPILDVFTALLSGRGADLYDHGHGGHGVGGGFFPLYPSLRKTPGPMGCDWIPLLRWADPGHRKVWGQYRTP